MTNTVETIDELQARVQCDPHRPVYHFAPACHWLNDPNGLIKWHGQYHMFYQHNPNGAFWGTMHWGHAVSSDLVHWAHWPIALAPTLGSYDWDGIFSGSAVDDGGVPTIMYTGVTPECQCIAVSHDGMRTWEKDAGNPVIPTPPAGQGEYTAFRDPRVWREGEAWYVVIGSGFKGVGGTALLYTSPDLRQWTYLGPLCVGDLEKYGETWECPDFFPLDGKHVLLFSDYKRTEYMIGAYQDHRFIAEVEGMTDGGHFYAAQTLHDDDRRILLIGWINEARPEAQHRASGWSGVMSLARVLSVRPDGLLGMEPAPEYQMLRGAQTSVEPTTIVPGGSGYSPELRGDCREIIAEFQVGDAERVGLRVRRSPGGEEETLIGYDRARGMMYVDRERGSLNPEVRHDEQCAPLTLAESEPLHLRIFLDHAVMEIYANGRACITGQVFPTRADSQGIDLFAEGGTARLARLESWEMASIW
jgi:beta-fructofuranosidase